MSLENRMSVVEEAVLIMKDLLISHDERLENYFDALNAERSEREESRKDFEFKLNALIDAQIRNQRTQGSIQINCNKSRKTGKIINPRNIL